MCYNLAKFQVAQGVPAENITIMTTYKGQFFALRQRCLQEPMLKKVKVVTVDRYQGEENDIVLLSLVRSNKVGFVKKLNRLCVALSRARIGLYIVGNAKILQEQSKDVWGYVLNMLQSRYCPPAIGPTMTVHCPRHPYNKHECTDPMSVPTTFCQERCTVVFNGCGHQCPSTCHFSLHAQYVAFDCVVFLVVRTCGS